MKRTALALGACTASLLTVCVAPVSAQQRSGFALTIENIMRGPELYGREPQRVRWSADNQWIYFSWLEPGAKWSEPLAPYRVRARAGATPERLTEAQMDSAGPLLADGSYSGDRRWKAVTFEGDLYLVDTRQASARRLTATVENESSPVITRDGRSVFYERDNNVFRLDLTSGLVTQVTNIRSGPAPRDSTFTGQRAVLRDQQLELFDAIREDSRIDSLRRATRETHEAHQLTPLRIASNERVGQISVSPAGNALLLTTFVPASGSRQTEVPQYVTASGYTEQLRVRTKVGDALSRSRVAFVPLATGEARWLTVTPGDTTQPPGQAFIAGWNDAGTAALLVVVTRDYETRWIHRVDTSGTLRTIDTLRDSAWVLTRGGGTTACGMCGGWLPGDRVWFTSEADGYAHLYTANADGSGRRQLTRGQWEVLDVTLSNDRSTFYLTTSESSPFNAQLYRMPVGGGARTLITTQTGMHQVALSPNEQWLAVVHSVANRPPELFLMRNQAGAQMAKLTTSPTAEWLSYNWLTPEIVHIPASDGVRVPARVYRPADVGATPNGAAVIFVHGAGYLHNVHNWWSSYSREYMFHHLLASRGYVVLDLDYRGSAGYGRDWRTAIYRHMGGRDLQDQVDGSRWLQREFGIDPERIGIYGGSYGGFITLMALFTEPEHFGAGAALRSVTDWAHYNHGYTAQILNTPQEDSVAYRRSSPIYFAEGLEDPLLMAHGMVDVNVHFQDIVRLTQRLIELGKENWELAVYPVEDHGFVRPDSWTDEYRRIFKLFEESLHPGGRTEAGAPGGRGAQR